MDPKSRPSPVDNPRHLRGFQAVDVTSLAHSGQHLLLQTSFPECNDSSGRKVTRIEAYCLARQARAR